MKTVRQYITGIVIYSLSMVCQSATEDMERGGYLRDFPLALGPRYELQVYATAGVTLNSMAAHTYFQAIDPLVPAKLQNFVQPVWSIFWTFNFTMWPHDFGHWARANQAGGDFRINTYRFPFPISEMIQPVEASQAERTLMSSGGFEINALMRRDVEYRFYEKGYGYADELIHAFIQTIMFPMYGFLIAPADPYDPKTWTDTYGDPVEYTLHIYKHYTGREAIRENGDVDQTLVDLYNETLLANTVWTLLDPMLYQGAAAFGVDSRKEQGRVYPWRLGNEDFSWSYSTRFNPSPLGYELYFINHLKLHQYLYFVEFRWGRPFQNLGVGLRTPNLWQSNSWRLGAAVDWWDQDIFGRGGAVSIQPRWHIGQRLDLAFDASWKDDGYLIGRRLDKDFTTLAYIIFSY